MSGNRGRGRRRMPAGVMAAAMLAVLATPGALAPPGAAAAPAAAEPAEAGDRYRFPEPTEGGRWWLRLEHHTLSGWIGPPEFELRLQGVEGYTPDGARHDKPVLTYVLDPDEEVWTHVFLSPTGTFGSASPWSATIGANRWEWIAIGYVDNPVRPWGPDWSYLGPGLWGTELAVGETVSLPAFLGDLGHVDVDVTLVAVDADGCASLRHEVLGTHTATVTHCDDALPRRVVVHDFTASWDPRVQITGDTMHLERIGDGGPLPVSPSWSPYEPEPFTDHPLDGSGLPFTMEEAHATALADRRTGTWLADHPDARVVRGRLTERLCRWQDDVPCLTALDDLRDQYTWELRWVASDGAWLEASITRVTAPLSLPATVTVATTGSDAGPPPDMDVAVPLADALAVWRSLTDDALEVEGVEWDLTLAAPVWRIWAEQVRVSGDSGTLRANFDIEMDTGLVRVGAIPPWVYSASQPAS